VKINFEISLPMQVGDDFHGCSWRWKSYGVGVV